MFSPDVVEKNAAMDDVFLAADRAAEREEVELGCDEHGWFLMADDETFYPIIDEAW